MTTTAAVHIFYMDYWYKQKVLAPAASLSVSGFGLHGKRGFRGQTGERCAASLSVRNRPPALAARQYSPAKWCGQWCEALGAGPGSIHILACIVCRALGE